MSIGTGIIAVEEVNKHQNMVNTGYGNFGTS